MGSLRRAGPFGLAALLLGFVATCRLEGEGICESTELREAIDGCNRCTCLRGGWSISLAACAVQLEPDEAGRACYVAPTADLDGQQVGIQPDCWFIASSDGATADDLVPPCEGEAPAWQIPDGEASCWALHPDLSDACLAEQDALGHPLIEIEHLLAPGTRPPVALRGVCQAWIESEDAPGCADAEPRSVAD